MQDWKEKLNSLKKTGTLVRAANEYDEKKRIHQSKKIIKNKNKFIHETKFCPDCKKKINKDVFQQHQLEIHKLKPKDIKIDVNNEKLKQISSAYSEKTPHKKINPKAKEKKIRDFKKIKDLNINLSGPTDYKDPESWVSNFKNPINFYEVDAFDITLGLDIGTSYTKAVIDFRDNKFAIDWRGISNFKDPFTLPSELSIIEKNFFVGRNPKAEKIISSFKIKLLQNENEEDYKYTFINYLKVIFSYIRAWWDHNHSELNEGKSLLWGINIGLPLGSMQEKGVVDFYKKITKEGWKRSYGNNIELLDDNSYEIKHFPEFSSQINTYLNSPKKQNGLHLLLDIGAGTTDICTFIVTENKDNDLKLPGMTSAVIPYGTHTLNNERYLLINKEKEYIETLSTIEFIKKYPVIAIASLEEIDENFIKFIAKEIKKILGVTKSRKYKTAREWKDGLTTFVCGGGLSSNIYNEIFDEVQKKADSYSTFLLNRMQIEKPTNLRGSFTINNFHRLSVAYGLSYSRFNQPEIPTYEIEDQKVATLKSKANFAGSYDK
jgi:hypothetical protein